MADLQRRSVLLRAGLVLGVAASSVVGAGAARGAPAAADEAALALLRRTFVLADEARRAGGAPYGALVADADGNVIAEHRNTAWGDGGDPTQHAELVATTDAWKVVGS